MQHDNLAVIVALLISLGWLLHRAARKTTDIPAYRSVAILVLGDIGRSPRMMYHAESFAKHNFATYIIAYKESKPLPSLLSMAHVKFLYIKEPPKFINGLPRALFLIFAPLKVLHQISRILQAFLIQIPHPPQYIVVQNPPSIPSLAIVWLVSRLRGSKVIIDWHNLGYTILALRLGEKHVIVTLARMYERYFGQVAYAHLFVTQAMHDFLVSSWKLRGHKVVLHDRPPAHFHKCSSSEAHELFVRLTPLIDTGETFFPPYSLPLITPFTEVVATPVLSDVAFLSSRETPSFRRDRPAIVITSTSWTPDEDFDMLIKALRLYERKAKLPDSKLPKILMIVTGSGPGRAKYMAMINQARKEEDWKSVLCLSLWLEAEDYPRLLGTCDLGISLHSSSSALDLPMKIVDMFGCGLPVCALNFKCLNELVEDGRNGLIFETAEQLAEQLGSLLHGFPDAKTLDVLKSSFPSEVPISPRHRSAWGSWDENWDEKVKPLVVREVAEDADMWLESFADEKRHQKQAQTPI